jgi:agmatinase
MRNDLRCGFDMVTARDLDRLGTEGIIARIKDRVGDSAVYISVDIDVLDPAFAPGMPYFRLTRTLASSAPAAS